MAKARRHAAFLLACALSLASLQPAVARDTRQAPPEFDFYVLSLSWSPSYCALEGADANQQQCGRTRPYAFVVHGLWPQFERGYPQFCANRQPDRVPNVLVDALRDIMPSAGLIGHQWRKHGSCSGMTQADYFSVVRKARERIMIPPAFAGLEKPKMVAPDAVEKSFIAANPGLPKMAIAVTCGRRYLREVRICVTKDLEFRACQEIDRKACRRDLTLMPPARGN